MQKSRGCSCSPSLSGRGSVHADGWLTGLLHTHRSSVCIGEMFHSWERGAEGPAGVFNRGWAPPWFWTWNRSHRCDGDAAAAACWFSHVQETFSHMLSPKNVVYSERDTLKEQLVPPCHILRGNEQLTSPHVHTLAWWMLSSWVYSQQEAFKHAGEDGCRQQQVAPSTA